MNRRPSTFLRNTPVKHFLTIAEWLPSYNRKLFAGDLFAGLTVAVILVPQAMAYALLAGLPPIYGLYASIVPLLAYPLIATSRHVALGVTAIDALIISAGVSMFAEPMSSEYILLVIFLTLLTGLIQMALGAFRLGFVVNLLSGPVITGFMTAAALIISISQIKYLTGLTIPRTESIFSTLAELGGQIGNAHLVTLLIGTAGILLLVILKRYAPRLPGPLVVVAIATLATWLMQLDSMGVAIVGEINGLLPTFELPSASGSALRNLLPIAVTLALVQFMAVYSLGKTYAAKNRYILKPNRELIAVGLANAVGSFFRSMPVSASFSRTAVNERAGGQTPLSNAVAAISVALVILFLTDWLHFVPIPILAAIIIVTVIGLIDFERVKFLFHVKKGDGLIAVATFLATIAIGITEGVGIGIVGSVIAIMYRISNPDVSELGQLPGTRSFRALSRYPEAERIPGIVLLRVDASFSFVNADLLRDVLVDKSVIKDIREIVIDASSINDLDTSAAASLATAVRILRERNIELYFGGVKDTVFHTMELAGLTELLGESHFFLSPHRAVQAILERRSETDAQQDSHE